jgi:hypothetical protein
MSEKTLPGRPRIDIDLELVYALAKIHCSVSEIASILGVSKDTINRRCGDIIERAKDEGRMSLRRGMFHKAINEGNVVMQIFLSKQWLGYSDNPVSSSSTKILPWNDEVDTAVQDEQEELNLSDDAKNVIKAEVEATISGDTEEMDDASAKGSNN